MEDYHTTNVEAAAAFERHRALPAWPEDEPDGDDLADTCERCGVELLWSEGPLCSECEEHR